MELRPGWMILQKAAQDLHDTNDSRAAIDIFRVFINQIYCRTEEQIPEDHVAEVIDIILRATKRTSTVMHTLVFQFLMNHGGQEVIDQFLVSSPGWEPGICPCGCQLLTVLNPGELEEHGMLISYSEQGQRGLVIRLQLPGRPNRTPGRRDDRGHPGQGRDRRN